MTAAEARARLAPHLPLLGVLTDREISARSGVSTYLVHAARQRRGIGKASAVGRLAVRRTPQCSHCGSVGHNRRTCGVS